jgi:hypothetical protein
VQLTDLVHAVQFLQAAYTILLGLAFSEAFKQFVPDGDANIRWDRLPSLMAFLFMVFPFYHGMSRYFYTTYLHESSLRLGPVAGFLMFDGMCFLLMSACFFVLSRSLSPSHWLRFYLFMFALLVVDSVWIIVSIYRGSPLLPWLWLNIPVSLVIMAFLFFRPELEDHKIETTIKSPTVAIALTTLLTTITDYTWMHNFYFP